MGRDGQKASAPVLRVDGVVLTRAPAGESHMRLSFLTATHGRLLCLQRQSRSKLGERADLFDDAEVVLEGPKSGGAYFVKEYRARVRRTGIGRSYDALACASEFAEILSRNAAQGFDTGPFLRLARLAFSVLESARAPRCALFKLLALLGIEEGYPVREDFLRRLDADARAAAEAILRTPLDAQTAAPETVDALLEKLRRWLKSDTDIWMP